MPDPFYGTWQTLRDNDAVLTQAKFAPAGGLTFRRLVAVPEAARHLDVDETNALARLFEEHASRVRQVRHLDIDETAALARQLQESWLATVHSNGTNMGDDVRGITILAEAQRYAPGVTADDLAAAFLAAQLPLRMDALYGDHAAEIGRHPELARWFTDSFSGGA